MMLSTPCELCCFGDCEKRACRAGQYCVEAGETFAAPGFCRLYRAQTWLKRQQEKGASLDLGCLIQEATRESTLTYDLMVLYDERVHTPEMLRLTLSTMDQAETNIIVDTTGAQTREHTALAVAKEFPRAPYKVECIVDNNTVGGKAIDLASRLVERSYFVVVEAGRRIMGLGQLRMELHCIQSRAVYWHFPFYVGKTAMVAPRTGMGVYLKAAFDRLGGYQEKPYWQKLADYEDKTGWSLSWLCERGALV